MWLRLARWQYLLPALFHPSVHKPHAGDPGCAGADDLNGS
jgi:hypothetical protein